MYTRRFISLFSNFRHISKLFSFVYIQNRKYQTLLLFVILTAIYILYSTQFSLKNNSLGPKENSRKLVTFYSQRQFKLKSDEGEPAIDISVSQTIPIVPTEHFNGRYWETSSESEQTACQIPRLNPFDPSIMDLVSPPEKLDCTDEYPHLFSALADSTLVQINDPLEFNYIHCCYRYVIRGNESDNDVSLSIECFPVGNKTTLVPPEHEFIAVICHTVDQNNNTETTQTMNITTNYSNYLQTGQPTNDKTEQSNSKEIQTDRPDNNQTEQSSHNQTETNEPGLIKVDDSEQPIIVDMFAFVPIKPNVEDRISLVNKTFTTKVANYTSDSENSRLNFQYREKKVNVVILGLDAVSHMNFIRTMPKTYSYLTKNLSAFGMFGYTKVGDNTFPNIVPVLTSLTFLELMDKYLSRTDPVFDDCPFLWKEFSAEGYRTSLAEDAQWMSIFNYQKKGFRNPPVDYYLRPLTYMQEKLIGTHMLVNAKICYGPRLAFTVLLDYMSKMAVTMRDRLYFQFIWATSLFHDFLNEGMLADELLHFTLSWFKNKGHLNNTVFILMSDHGVRWGEIRKRQQGKIEERMPMLYFTIPQWIQEKYPRAMINLKNNKYSLTTPFDLHETLKDILHLELISEENLTSRMNTLSLNFENATIPRGISVFLPIPAQRNCEMAAIEEHWCICHSRKFLEIKDNDLVKQAVAAVIFFINKMMQDFPQCALLSLASLLSAQSIQMENLVLSEEQIFELTLVTDPGNATFEATVIKDSLGHWSLSGDISRINLYGNQSFCVDEFVMKKYCFCL